MDTNKFYGIKRCTTLAEAMEEADECEYPTCITVLPPEAGDQPVESDTEEVNEDLNEGFEPAGRLELEFEGSDGESSGDEEVTTSLELDAQTSCGRRKSVGMNPKWRKVDQFDQLLPASSPDNLTDKYPELLSLSCFQLWKELFTDEMLEHISDHTNLYANRDKNDFSFQTNVDAIGRFLGIIIHSGYKSYPGERDYWSNSEGLGCQLVSNSMSRNSFLSIKKYIHFADNQKLVQGNKVAKILPLYNLFNSSIVKFGVFHQNLSIDESMVPYYGKHGAKMFIRGKPIRFGYKIWALCGSNGYPYHLQIYQGKEAGRPSQPLGSRVINDLVDVVLENSSPSFHRFYFDNFFSSYGLLDQLRTREVLATGTIRENRTSGAAALMQKISKKTDRGVYDYRSDGKVLTCKWSDNAVVCIASNHENVNPVSFVRRRVRGASDQSVSQPKLIHSYNQGMGGVDMMDKLLGSYRPVIRGKKWYFPLFVNILNLSVAAAWRLYCELHPSDKKTHLEFRYEVALCLIKGANYHGRRQLLGGRLPQTPNDIRYDGTGHERKSVKQGRCKVCGDNCRVFCEKCKVRLHRDKGKPCWDIYHTFE